MPELEAAIREAADPHVVLQRVADEAVRLIEPASGAAIELVDGDELVYVCTAGALVGARGTRLAVASSLSGLAASSGQTLVAVDTEVDDRVDREACRRVGARSMVCVPIRPHDTMLGVLKMTSADPDAFGEEDLLRLAHLADFVTVTVASAAELARVTATLRQQTSLPEREFIANVLRPEIVDEVRARGRLQTVLADADFSIVLQPIVHLADRRVVGYEALSRFSDGRTPDVWFGEAHSVDLGEPLELMAITKALELLPEIPDDAFLALNLSPTLIGSPQLTEKLTAAGPGRIVLELTEHFPVDDYRSLRTALIDLRRAGMRIALDDTGSGYTSLGHLLKLSPELIKLDRVFTHRIDRDPVRRSLAASLLRFAEETGSEILAEGVETEAELAMVRELGIPYAQGYLVGRPAPWTGLEAQRHDAA